ncbi:MAG TPA: hypothetical protein VNK89_04140 [Thermoflexus sp.]|nr:hypothetical protein [Thermoflexus sp.]
MPFSAEDFQDLLEQLKAHPEWQETLRRLLWAESMAELTSLLRLLVESLQRAHEVAHRFVEAQQQTDALLTRLTDAVIRLAEAHARGEERIARLEESQRRLGEAVTRLIEAQTHLEERVDRLEEAVTRLIEAQTRTEERVSRLEEAVTRLIEAQARLEEQVAILVQTQEQILRRLEHLEGIQREFEAYKAMFGATLEEEAEAMVRWVLEQKGYRPIGQGYPLTLPVYEEGEKGEVDAVIPLQTPDQRIVWAVVEAKARQSPRAIQAWANRMRSEGFRKRLAEAGVPGPYLVYAYGIRVDPACERMAEALGIGLVTGRGERVPPAEEIAAAS